MEEIKWQLHAETSITQIMLWVVIWKLFGGVIGIVAFVFIVLNILTIFKSADRIKKDYFK